MRRGAAALALALLLGPAAARDKTVDAIAAIKPSLVVVGTFREQSSPRFEMHGTGFAVLDGHLVATNAHVLEAEPGQPPDAALAVVVHPGRADAQFRSLKVIEVDKLHDLALLRIDGEALPPVHLGDSDSVAEGQSIAFMGFPLGPALGYSPVTHRGIVSSIAPMALPMPTSSQLDGTSVTRLRDGNFRIFQLDATAYPGNSGGPLFDPDSGQVIGLLSMVAVKGGRESMLSHPSGISYAVPVRHLQQMLDKQPSR